MQDFVEHRMIRVFISSTFQDMQGERDYLMTKTFPRLRFIASQRDVTLTEVDLRWGITEEESNSGRTVEICLNEIDNSLPFFIGIVGNRYGWCPERSEIGDGAVMERFGKWIEPCLEKHLSVTEMEIQYGVIAREENVNAFFYLKEDAGEPDDSEKLEDLKRKIRESSYPVEQYGSLEELGGKVEKAFLSLIDRVFPEGNLSEVEMEKITQRSFMNSLSQTYVRVDSNFAPLDAFLDSQEQYFVVTGASGLGKSALIANWLKSSAMKRDNLSVVYHFVGNGGSIGSYLHVKRALAGEICSLYGLDDMDLEKAVANAGASGRPLLIVIDAINQILDVDNSKQLGWIPFLPKNVKIVYSTLENDSTMTVFCNRHYPIFTISALCPDQRRELVNTYLKDNFGKTLSSAQVERIINGSQCENTLVLKTLLNELIKYGVYETIDEKIDSLLKYDSIPAFYEAILEAYESDFGQELVKNLLSLIAVSREGLSEIELLEISGCKPLYWSHFFCAFSSHLNVKSGLISFSHSYVREAVESKYLLNDSEFESFCRNSIASYFKNHQTVRTMTELPYQCFMLEDCSSMHAFLLAPEVLEFWVRHDVVEFAKYWKMLLEKPDGEYSMDDYLPLVDNVDDKISFYVDIINLASTVADHPRKKQYCQILHDYLNKNGTEAEAEVYRVLCGGLGQLLYLKLAHKALESSISTYGEVNDDTAKSYGSVGAAYYDLAVAEGDENYGRMAFDAWKRQNEIAVQLHGEVTPSVAESYRAMALQAPDPEEGLKYGLKSIEISMAVYGEHHPDLGWSYNHTGCVYRGLGQHDKALDCFKKSYDCWFPAYGEWHDLVGTSVNNQACCYCSLGDYEKALELHFRAHRIRAKVWGGGHDNANSILNIGSTYYLMKDYDNAVDYLKKALKIFDDEADRPYYTALAHEKLSKVYADMGCLNDAEWHKKKAEEINAKK